MIRIFNAEKAKRLKLKSEKVKVRGYTDEDRKIVYQICYLFILLN